MVWLLYREALATGRPIAAIDEEEFSHTDMPLWAGAAWSLLGLATLIGGSKILIPAAVEVARYFGWSDALIGVTLIAIGTSAPELATSLVAALRKESDIAVGNIIGSNIFNIGAVLGLVSLIHPIAIDARFLRADMPILLAVSLLLFALIIWRCKTIPRWLGGLMLAGFFGYNYLQFFHLG